MSTETHPRHKCLSLFLKFESSRISKNYLNGVMKKVPCRHVADARFTVAGTSLSYSVVSLNLDFGLMNKKSLKIYLFNKRM